MEFWLWVTIGIMALAMAALMIKIYMLQKSAREIKDAFADKFMTDTNTLIDISCGDRYMRDLADSVNQQLRRLYRERHRFQQGDLELKTAITNISHDLRTPLTAICAYLDLLGREKTDERVRRYLVQIQDRTEALKNLTEELFRYSVAASAPKLKPEQLNVVSVLEESLLSFYGLMQEKGIRPQIDLPEAPVCRELDRDALSRIFSNIIGNALKYTDGDFAVMMRDDGSIVFSNTARSLNSLDVGKLFDRFYTVEANSNSTGLGLSIAKLLTERMGGLIKADYIDGKLWITVRFISRKSP